MGGHRIFEQLRGFGVAGMLAYGLLNSAYYSLAFLTLWLVPTTPSSTLFTAKREVDMCTWMAGSLSTQHPQALAIVRRWRGMGF